MRGRGHLLVAVVVPLERFAGKAFGARLLAYPVAMVAVPAVLAVGWEVAEWFTFIRHGTELDTAYEDTLGDEVLGCLGAPVAGLLVARRARRG